LRVRRRLVVGEVKHSYQVGASVRRLAIVRGLVLTHLLQFATEDPCNLLILLGGVVSDAKM
jgi:hypothetical protein